MKGLVTELYMIHLNEIKLNIKNNNIKKRISGSQVIITNGEFILSKSIAEGDTYITRITDIDSPEKVLLNIKEKGFYQIGYVNDDFTIKKINRL